MGSIGGIPGIIGGAVIGGCVGMVFDKLNERERKEKMEKERKKRVA